MFALCSTKAGKKQSYIHRTLCRTAGTMFEHRLFKFTSVLQPFAVQKDLLNWTEKLYRRITCRDNIWLPAPGCPSVPPQRWSFPHHRTAELKTRDTQRRLLCTQPRHRAYADLSFVLFFFHRCSNFDLTSNKISAGTIFYDVAIFSWLNERLFGKITSFRTTATL